MLEYLPVLKLRIFHLTNYRVFFLIDHVHVKDHFNIQCLREIQSHNFKQDPIVTRSESSQRGLMNYSALAELLSIVVSGIVGDGCTYICCLSYWMWVPWVEACLMQDNVKIVSNNLFLYQATFGYMQEGKLTSIFKPWLPRTLQAPIALRRIIH